MVDLAGCNPVVASLGGPGGTISNSSTASSTLTVNQATTTAFGGVLTDGSGGLSLVLSGSGGLCLTGSNTYSGGTTVTGGTLQLGNNSALGAGGLTVNAGMVDLAGCNPVVTSLGGLGGTISNSSTASSTLTVNQATTTAFGGVLADGSGGLSLVLSGSGGLCLTGSNTYGGGTTVTGGTLQLGNNSALGAGGLTVNAGMVDLAGCNPLVTSLGGLGGTISNSSTASSTLTVNQATTTAFGGVLTDGSGGLSLVLSGSGGLCLTGSNTYSGGTTVTGGTLQLGNNSGLGTGGLTVTAGMVDLAGCNPVVASLGGLGGTISNSSTASSTLTVNQATTTAFGGVLTDGSGGLSLVLSGSGGLCLTGSNTYSGGTTVTGGTLQLGNNSALGTGGLTVNAGMVDLAGCNPLVTSLGGLGGTISNSSTASSTLTVNQATTTTFGGVLTDGSGSLSLVLSGSGGLCLTGSNTYSGGTTVTGGTLQLGNGGASGSLTGNIVNNAALVFSRSDTYAFLGSTSGSGALYQSGNGMLTLAGSNSCGSMYVSAGTLAVSGGLSATSSVYVGGNGTSGVGNGQLTVSGGATVANRAATIASNAGSSGTATVTDVGSSWASSTDLLVGGAGSGSLYVQWGGSVLSNYVSIGYAGGGYAAGSGSTSGGGFVDLFGPGASLTSASDLEVGGSARDGQFGNGQLIVHAGASVSCGRNLYVGAYGSTGGYSIGNLTVSDSNSSVVVAGNLLVGTSANGYSAEGTLTVNQGGLVDVGSMIDVLNGSVYLNGGTIRARSIGGLPITFNSGTINLTGDNLSIDNGGTFGSLLTLPSGSAVNVTNNASIAAGGSLIMQGGGFSAAMLANNGTIGGSGQIGAPLTNAPGGQVCASTGDHTIFTGSSNVNQGQIQLSGGTVEFTGAVTNSPGGMIEGNGALIVSGGLLNSGTMALSAVTNISGPVQNGPGALVSTASGTTSFWGNVINSGTISTGVGGSSIFYGTVSGDGMFTGPGIVAVDGSLSPGHSPGTISFADQAYFSQRSRIDIELAGPLAGTQYDQVVVAGGATLAGGALNVTLLNGFRPVQNEQFTVLTFGSRSGDFASETGLDLGGRLQLVPAYTSNSLVLTAVQGGSGAWRFDSDGVVSVSTNWSGGLPNGAGDIATFGSAITQARTVTIDAPTIFGQVVFDSPVGYTLSGSGANTLTLNNSGSGATITVTGGQHAIDAPVVLADNLVVQSGGDNPWTLMLGSSSSIAETGGSRSLTMNGASGTLILSGTGTFSGGTNVTAGTLILTSNSAVLDGSSLAVGAGGTFVFDPSAMSEDDSLTVVADAAPRFDSAFGQMPLPQNALLGEAVVTLVPEPGTFILLLVATVGAFLALRHARGRV